MSTPSERWFVLHTLRRQLSFPPKNLNRNSCLSSRGVLDRIYSERAPISYYDRRNLRWRSQISRLELFIDEARWCSHTGWRIQCFLGSTQDTAVKLTSGSFKLCDFLTILTVRVTRHTNSTSDIPDSNVPSWSYPTSDSCCSQKPDMRRMYVERMFFKQTSSKKWWKQPWAWLQHILTSLTRNFMILPRKSNSSTTYEFTFLEHCI